MSRYEKINYEELERLAVVGGVEKKEKTRITCPILWSKTCKILRSIITAYAPVEGPIDVEPFEP